MPRPHPPARDLRLECLEARETPAAVGALDPSFGTAGLLRTTFGATDAAAGVAVQADGKIVVAGSTSQGTDFAVARYLPDGTLDPSFSGDGKQTIDFGVNERATAVTIQADGKIVVAGFGTIGGDDDFLVARLDTAGEPDNTFSADGKRTFNFAGGGTNNDQAFGVTTQTVGGANKVVVVGSVDVGGITGINFGVLRLNDDGTTDISFNKTLGGTDVARAVAIDGQNRIVVGGTTNAFGTNDFGVARFTTAGAIDPAFNGGAIQTVDFGSDDQLRGLVVQPDDKIVAAGSFGVGGADFAVLRLDAAGVLDGTFGTGGKFTQGFGGVDLANGVALDRDGRVVVAGTTDQGGGTVNNYAVLRLTPAGTLDPSFDGDGLAIADGGGSETGNGVAIDNNGRIVVAGGTSTNNDFSLARFIGTVEKGTDLAVGGSFDGRAVVFTPDAAGTFAAPTPTPANLFPGFTGNVRTATADVNGDGVADTILVTGPGTPIRFAVVSGSDGTTVLVPPTAPFVGSETFTGGGYVAAADIDNDGRAEFAFTPDQGGGPRVTVYSLAGTAATVRANFLGIDDAAFRGGARVGAGDVNGDGVADLVVAAGFGGGPRVAVFDGRSLLTATQTKLLGDFFAFPDVLRNGVYVAVGDVDGDGFADLVIGAGPGGGPQVLTLSGKTLTQTGAVQAVAAPLSSFFVAGTDSDRGGVRVAVVDADGDNRADVATGTGEARPERVRVYLGKNFSGVGEPAAFQDLTAFGGATLADGIYVG